MAFSALAAREQATLQGPAVRCQFAVLPKKERNCTATFCAIVFKSDAVPFEEYSRVGERCVHKGMNAMPKSLTMFVLLTGLTGLFIAPSPASAHVCNPALAAGFLYQCPPATEGLFDNRGFRHSRGDDGFRDNHGFHGDGGDNNFGRGVGHGGGMGHGGGAGRGR
jgi:hypothetical protein